jgi:hypothetical protein
MQVTTVGVTGSFNMKRLNYKEGDPFPKVLHPFTLVFGFWYKDFFRHITIYVDNSDSDSTKIHSSE